MAFGLRGPTLDQIVGEAGVTAAYQPVVDLETREIRGYEALARVGPDAVDAHPEALFGCARERDLVADLDWACREAALQGALDAELGNSLTLFVNVEPDTDASPVPKAMKEVIRRAEQALRVVVEVTEKAVVERPAELLQVINWARDRSWGVALDDLGANPSSLAMMPFLEPDVIKLDLTLVQDHPSPEIGQIVSAVLAQAERTGASIVAEGVETEEHFQAALAMGATLGQGWLFGRPEALPTTLPTLDATIPLLRSAGPRRELTPFSVVRSARPLRRSDRTLLHEICSHLQEQAIGWRESPVILCAFEEGHVPDEETARRLETLAEQGSFVVTLGCDDEIDGVRSAPLGDGDRLRAERSMVVVGPHYAGAVVARVTPEQDPECEYAVTHDRDLVIEAGRVLLRQLADRA